MISNPLKANKSNISFTLPANACLKGKINYLTLIHPISIEFLPLFTATDSTTYPRCTRCTLYIYLYRSVRNSSSICRN